MATRLWRSRASRLGMSFGLAAALLSGAVLAFPNTANADTGVHPRVCWRGRPWPECSSFFVTEFASGVVSTHRYQSLYFHTDGGYMHNLHDASAVGATISMQVENSDFQLGLNARYRRWLDKDWALDFTPGYVRMFGGPDGAGLQTRIALSYKDWVGLDTGVVVVKENRPLWYAGAKMGSVLGLGVGIGAGISAVVLAILIASSLGD